MFQAEQRATYEAARAAALDLGYRIIRGGPAEGQLDALSEIAQGETLGSSRQISMKVRMVPAAEGGTSVEVSLTEIIEGDTGGHPGMRPKRPCATPPFTRFSSATFKRPLWRSRTDGSH